MTRVCLCLLACVSDSGSQVYLLAVSSLSKAATGAVIVAVAVAAPSPIIPSRCCANAPFFGSAIQFSANFATLNDYLDEKTRLFDGKTWCGVMPTVSEQRASTKEWLAVLLCTFGAALVLTVAVV